MANTIKLKRGTSTPTTSDLSNGEVGLDTSAKKLYVNDSGTIKEIGGTTSPNFIYLELRNSSNNGSASYPNNDFTLVIAGTTTAQTVGAANQLLVSVSGVIQQPNSGTSTSGITGFIVDGNRLKTATNLPSAPDFIIFQKAGGIGEPSDGSVTSAKLSSSINSQITANTAKVSNATHTGEVTGSTALTIADNVVDEANLKVSNSPTNGYFLSAQSGNTGGLTWAEVTTDLVGDTSPQLGGDLLSNGNDIDFADNDKANFGAGDRLSIYHDSSSGHSFIKETGSGSLVINANDFYVQNVATETMIKAASNGAAELYHNNTLRLATTNIGVTITGDLSFSSASSKAIRLGDNDRIYFGDGEDFWIGSNGSNGEVSGSLWYYNHQNYYDNVRIRLGNSQDLEFYHDASHSWIKNNTGNLYINPKGGEVGIALVPDGKVELRYDDVTKLETASGGVDISGALSVTNGISLPDLKELKLGDNNDLIIVHTGFASYINNNSGDLYIRNDNANDNANILIQARDGENSIYCHDDGAVELYHDNSKKLETTSTGVNITGGITINGSALSSGGLKQTKFTSVHDTSGSTNFSTSWTQVLSLDITPSSSSHKISIFNSTTLFISNTSGNLYALPEAYRKLTRTVGGTETTLLESKVLSQRDNYNGTKYQDGEASTTFQDSPNTTSQVTYKIYLYKGNNTETAYFSASTLHLMETAV